MLISRLGAGDLAEIVAVLNRAFSDYVTPAHFTVEMLRMMVARDNIRLDQSYLAREAPGAGVGVALTAVRRNGDRVRSRVAAMGVAPEGRGRGIGRALLARQLADARARGSRDVILECFTNNQRALPLYQSMGFQA